MDDERPDSTQVLVVGAGPTGLMLALWLARAGVSVRIIDKTAGPGTTSRALVVHARTLEFYRQLGLDEIAIGRGLKFAAVNLWARGEKAGRIAIGDIGANESHFPFMLILGQDRQEEMLVEALRESGVEVERQTELGWFEEHGDRVTAQLKSPDGERKVECAWLAGCDGAHSTVREALRVGFPGGTYHHVYYVADIHGRGPALNGELNVALDETDFLAIFPLPGEGNARLVGTVERGVEGVERKFEWDDVGKKILERMHVEVDRVNWFSTYHVHHRVTSAFRVGRTFLLGDAAHIHSPVGGQGMNTGLGDAVNLGWKLAMVCSGHARDELLDSYEPERIAFARRLVETTDRVFTFVTSDGPIARFVRLNVVPHVLPGIMSHEAARRALFRTISQIEIEYHASALSDGSAGGVKGGDRLPWIADNFAPLASRQWQVHVYGAPSPGLGSKCQTLDLALHSFPWSDAAREAGFARDASYLVRPDGYVALADASASRARLERYMREHGLSLTAGSRPAELAA